MVTEITQYPARLCFADNWQNYEILLILNHLQFISLIFTFSCFCLNCACITTLVRQPHYAGGRCADKLEEYTAVLENRASLDSIAGTYNGVLPPNVETTLTLNADGTYLLIRTFKEKQNEREKLRGTFQVLDGNILMLVHPSSGDNKFYKVRDANHIVLIDSFGNEPQKEVRKNYILKKK
ncbi:copper resistance protein NlpE N-terminal domain-containing protein [Segatella copri]|uniref:copper resistance protein NlpE N-terminal domain-containing protein n=1 Tax=Segatella copri TaxID=165179 RepID=UPI001D172E87|nr:copper resistance protein NlpE [Segatella copri]